MKKLGVGLLIGLFMISFVFALCSDSDGGKNSFKKGYTSDEYINYQDFCISNSDNEIKYKVVENYCLGDKADVVIIECDYKCNKGRCINKPLTTKIIDYFYSASDNEQIKKVVDSCIVKNSNTALKKIGLNGGRINPEKFTMIGREKIMYGYLNGENILILNNEIEKEIEQYLKVKVPKCIKKTYKNEEVKVDSVNVNVKNKEVYVSSKISVSNNKVSSRNFLPIKINKLRKLANKIIKRESRYMDYSELSFLAELGYYIIVTPITNGKVIVIVDSSVSIDNEPFVFRFVMKDNQALMNQGFLQNVFSLFTGGLYTGTAKNAYEGGVETPEEGITEPETTAEIEIPTIPPTECASNDNPDQFCRKYVLDSGDFAENCYQDISCDIEGINSNSFENGCTVKMDNGCMPNLGCVYAPLDCSLSSLFKKGLIINTKDGYSILRDSYPITDNPEELPTIGIFKSPVNKQVYYKLSEYIGDETTYCSNKGFCVSVQELGDYDFSKINLLAMNHNKKSKITGNVIMQSSALIRQLAEGILKINPAKKAAVEAILKTGGETGLRTLTKMLAEESANAMGLSSGCAAQYVNELDSILGNLKAMKEIEEISISDAGLSCAPEELGTRLGEGIYRNGNRLFIIPPKSSSGPSVFGTLTDLHGDLCDAPTEEAVNDYLAGVGEVCKAPTTEGTEGSFLADTQIMMADGSYKNIKDIVLGEKVMAYDIINNKPVVAPVTHTFNYPETSYRIIEYEIVE